MDLNTLNETPPWEWPESAAETILAVLRDSGAEEGDRLLAAELAGDPVVIDDMLATVLLEIACDARETEDLRKEAVRSLGPVLEASDIEGFDDPDEAPITEEVFHKLQQTLHDLYRDENVSGEMRREALVASVRAPLDWHEDAILKAYSSGDDFWMVAAVFCMRFVRGFHDQILESLANKNEDIQYHAVCAAGDKELDGAWAHVSKLVTSERTNKDLRLAAIESIAAIRPSEAIEILDPLTASKDEDIAEAAQEALAMADGFLADMADEGEEEH
ncbi:MAG: hypothetical protein ABFD97_06400 [Syntrophobacter sp.]